MADRTCSVDGCGGLHYARGWCAKHYACWRRHGDPTFISYEHHKCAVSWCERTAIAHELCPAHLHRQRNGKDLDVPFQPRRQTLKLAVRRNVRIGGPDECWPAKTLQADGYGQLAAQNKMWLAHRAAWIAFVGPLAADLQLHHLCRNRACANPAHLQPVTQAEHIALHAH